MENLISSDADHVQAPRINRTAFAKKQAHNQIHAFMDCYQKDMIGRLAPKSLAYGQAQEPKPLSVHAENDNGAVLNKIALHPKNDRERLHKIWLAMKPVFKPSTSF